MLLVLSLFVVLSSFRAVAMEETGAPGADSSTAPGTLKEQLAVLKAELKANREDRLRALRDIRNLKRRQARLKRAAGALCAEDLAELVAATTQAKPKPKARTTKRSCGKAALESSTAATPGSASSGAAGAATGTAPTSASGADGQ